MIRMRHTFFSFAFSVCSSLLAFAACRFSCLVVNYVPSSVSRASTSRVVDMMHLQVEEGFLQAGHLVGIDCKRESW